MIGKEAKMGKPPKAMDGGSLRAQIHRNHWDEMSRLARTVILDSMLVG